MTLQLSKERIIKGVINKLILNILGCCRKHKIPSALLQQLLREYNNYYNYYRNEKNTVNFMEYKINKINNFLSLRRICFLIKIKNRDKQIHSENIRFFIPPNDQSKIFVGITTINGQKNRNHELFFNISSIKNLDIK